MAGEDDWRAERAAKLVGTPFERPRETVRSRVDDTLPIQRAPPGNVPSTSAMPNVSPAGARAASAKPATPAAAVKPRAAFVVRGWAIAAGLVVALISGVVYLLASDWDSDGPDRSAAVRSTVVAHAAPAVRPTLPKPAQPIATPPQAPATEGAALTSSPQPTRVVISPLSTGPAVQNIPLITKPAKVAATPPFAPTDHSRVDVAAGSAVGIRASTAIAKHPAVATNNTPASRGAAARSKVATTDRRIAAAIPRRDDRPTNTVFATPRKSPEATPLPPCDLSNRAEAAVCASPALSALRRQVHDLYVGVGTDGDPKLIAKAQREQAGFLKRRDRCKDNACLTRQYTHQVEALQKFRVKAAAARARAAAKALPTCAAGQRPSPTLCRPAHHRISLKKLFGIKHS